jgi:hypothetical protein
MKVSHEPGPSGVSLSVPPSEIPPQNASISQTSQLSESTSAYHPVCTSTSNVSLRIRTAAVIPTRPSFGRMHFITRTSRILQLNFAGLTEAPKRHFLRVVYRRSNLRGSGGAEKVAERRRCSSRTPSSVSCSSVPQTGVRRGVRSALNIVSRVGPCGIRMHLGCWLAWFRTSLVL